MPDKFIRNSRFFGWVSVETGYPVKLEADIVANNGNLHIEMMMDQFLWDVELDESVFKVDIPSITLSWKCLNPNGNPNTSLTPG